MPFACLQLLNHVEQLLTDWGCNINFFTFPDHVSEGEIDLGLDALLNLAERPFAVIDLPGFGRLIQRRKALFKRMGRVKVSRVVLRKRDEACARRRASIPVTMPYLLSVSPGTICRLNLLQSSPAPNWLAIAPSNK